MSNITVLGATGGIGHAITTELVTRGPPWGRGEAHVPFNGTMSHLQVMSDLRQS